MSGAIRKPTHRCNRCGALWIESPELWSLFSLKCGPCCDNKAMGEQIEELPVSGGSKPMHSAIAGLIQFFAFSHLPAHLAAISAPFAELAWVVANGPQNTETTVALRKLLEAKDCAVRAALVKP